MELVRGYSRAFWLVGTGLLLLLAQSSSEKTLKEIMKMCLQPLDEGKCRASEERWYYDRYSQTCKAFMYGDCEGNENIFKSQKECSSFCMRIKKVPRKCRMEADPGICRASFRKFYFNLESMKCEEFIYGGCEGNDNRFDSAKACRNFCLQDIPSICNDPKDEGLCSASIPRFYYNAEERKCEQFNWTGCGGNNNFVSERDCFRACSKGKRKPRYLI